MNRQAKPKPKAKSQPKPQEPIQVPPEFMLPNLGFSLPQSSQSGAAGSEVPVVPQTASKSIKTQLHQRANRIGKVENRIQRLQQGLNEVSQSWPAHVQEKTQSLQNDYQKCLTFQNQASKELESLQQELQGLLHQRLDQEVHCKEMTNLVDQPQEEVAGSSGNDVLPQVLSIISQLQAQGIIQVNAPVSGMAPMDCTEIPASVVQNPTGHFPQVVPTRVQTPHMMVGPQPLHPMHSSVGMPLPYQVPPPMAPVQPPIGNQPDMHHAMPVGAQYVPNMLPQSQTQDPNLQFRQGPNMSYAHVMQCIPDPMTPPPGNWAAPQTPPQMPSNTGSTQASVTASPQPSVGNSHGPKYVLPIAQTSNQHDGNVMFPNPLYKPPATLSQSGTEQPSHPKGDQVSTEQAIATATTALLNMYSVQTPAQLPADVQNQLQAFAAQQEYCRQQIAQFTQNGRTAEVPKTPETKLNPQTPPRSNGAQVPTTPVFPDAMSINSSPEKMPEMSASPQGQRTPKIPKSVPGNIHEQPTVATQENGETIPIPLSPCQSQASMVPTEIAESEWHGPPSGEQCG